MNNITEKTKQSTVIQRRKSQRSTVEELRKKYESFAKSPKKIKKSNVKRTASIYKSKVTQMIKSDVDNGKYLKEIKDLLVMPQNIHLKTKVPISSPRTKSRAEIHQPSHYFVAEDSLDKLTVKDKTRLYNQFIKNMVNKSDMENKENKNTVIKKEADEEFKAVDILKFANSASIIEVKSIRNGSSSSMETAQISLPKQSETTYSMFGIFSPIPDLRHYYTDNSTPISVKLSLSEESDLGLSSYSNNNSFESLSETQKNENENSETQFNFAIPLMALRKKKLHRNTPLKKDLSLKYCRPFSSTDSETDYKPTETKVNESNFVECFQTPITEIKSNCPIKLSYTPKENDLKTFQSDTAADFSPRELLNQVIKDLEMDNFDELANLIKYVDIAETQSATDSLTDQGFETENYEKDSSLGTPQKSPLNQNKDSINNFKFSTPINDDYQPSFNCIDSAKQQLFSPIEKSLKYLRTFFNDPESQPKILAMEVIPEDQPLAPHLQSALFNNLTNPGMNSNFATINNERISKFWIKCDNFSISVDIFYNDNERLRLLHQMFSQTSFNSTDLYFGIDEYKFSLHSSNDGKNLSSHLSAIEGQSHYWFSNRELTIPFSGKYLTPQKIQCMFQFIRGSADETGILHFGVDEIEFSNTCALINENSLERKSESDNSNNLEDLGEYTWHRAEAVIVTDLDESTYKKEEEVDDVFEVIEPVRLSNSTHDNSHCELSSLETKDLTTPRKSSAHQRLESFCESLDKLFENNLNRNPDNKNTQAKAISSPKILKVLQQPQQHKAQDEFPPCHKPTYPFNEVLQNLQETPECLNKLKGIASDISHIVNNNKLKELSFQQIEYYIHFLLRYVDICLNICQHNKDNVSDVSND